LFLCREMSWGRGLEVLELLFQLLVLPDVIDATAGAVVISVRIFFGIDLRVTLTVAASAEGDHLLQLHFKDGRVRRLI